MEHPQVKRSIVDFVAARMPRPAAAGLTDETPLLTGALDSLGVLELMMHLDQTFAIGLDDADFEADNMATVGHLVRFVERKRAA